MRIKLPGCDERDTTPAEDAALEVDFCDTHLESVGADRWAKAWETLHDLCGGEPKTTFGMLRWAAVNARYIIPTVLIGALLGAAISFIHAFFLS